MIRFGRMRARGQHRGRTVAAATATTLLAASLALAVSAPQDVTAVAVTPVSARVATSQAAAELSLQRRVVRVTNRRRDAHGLAPLRVLRCPKRYAVRHSARMARRDWFGHSNLARLADRCSAPRVAENIAYFGGSAPTARKVVRTWMRSPGHRANILDDSVTHLGVGVVRGGGRWYLTQAFIAR